MQLGQFTRHAGFPGAQNIGHVSQAGGQTASRLEKHQGRTDRRHARQHPPPRAASRRRKTTKLKSVGGQTGQHQTRHDGGGTGQHGDQNVCVLTGAHQFISGIRNKRRPRVADQRYRFAPLHAHDQTGP